MRVSSVISLFVAAFILVIEKNASGTYIALDDGDATEHHPHSRMARSPFWGKRFRVKIKVPNPVKVPNPIKIATQVGGGIRDIVKGGLDIVTPGAEAEIKKAAKQLATAVEQAKKDVIPAIVVANSGKLGHLLTIRLAAELLKELVSLNKRKLELEEETPPTFSTAPTRPGCGTSCQLMKKLLKGVEFCKQAYCAFYTVKRQHRDLFDERNDNLTITGIINTVKKGSFGFYKDISKAYNNLIEKGKLSDAKVVIESRKKLSRDCSEGGLMPCNSTAFDENMLRLKCLVPCSGFEGCKQQDGRLMKTLDSAYLAYLHWMEGLKNSLS